MKEKFVEKTFSPESEAMIAKLNEIVEIYAGQGYRLSLRQLYYQLVSRDLVENTVQSYKRVGDLVNNARLAGRLDWNMIEDRGRETVAPPMWRDPAQIVDAAAAQFAIDRWEDQPTHVEVMVEKDALSGVLVPVCRENGVLFTSNKGYSSSSTMYDVGKRLKRNTHTFRKDVYILYLGDHDPSGIDMTRDVRDRTSLFSGSDIEVQRLALNMDQIDELHPPENPAKTTDSRAAAYIAEFGMSSWELDAIEPAALAEIVTKAIKALRNEKLWKQALKKEAGMRAQLKAFAKQYRQEHPADEVVSEDEDYPNEGDDEE